MKRIMIKTMVVGSALAGSLLVTPAHAALVIDSFVDGTAPAISVDSSDPYAANSRFATAIGGTRSLALYYVSGDGYSSAKVQAKVAGGKAYLNNAEGSQANLGISWNIPGSTALPGVVQFMAGSDNGADIRITLTSSYDGEKSVNNTLSANSSDKLLSYNFGNWAGLANVTGISMTIFGNKDGTDVSVYGVSAVPETSTWVAGCGALGIMLLFGLRAHSRTPKVFRVGAQNV